MRKLTKLSALAASALALGLGTANAAVFVEGGVDSAVNVGPQTITADVGAEFINNDLNLAGSFVTDNNTASVIVGEGVTRLALDFDVDQALPNGRNARGIENFALTVMGTSGTMFSLSGITDAAGFLQLGLTNEFAVVAGETLTFVFSGTAFANGTQFTPGYSVGAFAVNEVPVPAAGLLFASAIIGGAAARRRAKA